MPVQTVTPTSPVAGSMLTVAGTIAGSNGAAPDGMLTVTVSSPFQSLSVQVARLLQDDMCGNQLSVLSTCPFLCWGVVAACCSFVVGVFCPAMSICCAPSCPWRCRTLTGGRFASGRSALPRYQAVGPLGRGSVT